MKNNTPREHRPYGVKVNCPVDCMCGKNSGYCIGMICWCKDEGLEHIDFDYRENSDGFHFYFPCCNLEINLTIGECKKFERINGNR